MLVNIQALLDDAKCYEAVRQFRWADGVRCLACPATEITKRGFHTPQAPRQRYQCKACGHQFDDWSGTVFDGHQQPLRTWILCLYFMGLNLSTQQIAAELDVPPDDAHNLTTHLREGIEVKKSQSPSAVPLNSMQSM